LPQLFNIIKGDMSIVGPRPERPEFVSQLSEKIPYYQERHQVKVGLTGWAQINYPYGASDEDAKEKLKYDLYYIKHHSLWLDFLTLLQTVEVILLGKGVR
jgi:lipopolysaccharide/colanic/teichoic acid biosynthesis glycosyltransferase